MLMYMTHVISVIILNLDSSYSTSFNFGKYPISVDHSLSNYSTFNEQIANDEENTESNFFNISQIQTIQPRGIPGTNFQSLFNQNVADTCIPFLQCNKSERYRSINGSCNNLKFPMWGSTGTALVRVVSAKYENGNHQPRLTVSGKALPNVRELRKILLPNKSTPDYINTRIVMEWGQIISHDTAQLSTHLLNNEGSKCCIGIQYPIQNQLPPDCMPIKIPVNDKYFSKFNQTCLYNTRSKTTNNYGCPLVPQQQLSLVTHFIDASFIYGSREDVTNHIREGKGGRLKVNFSPDGREFPPNLQNAMRFCNVSTDNGICFFGGDTRINQNTDVTVMQVIFLREHNKLCAELSTINPHWDDERLFQESRRIVIAAVQRITYTDFLSSVIGFKNTHENSILDFAYESLYDGYDELLNPSTINSFTSSVYRAFHSLIPSTIELMDENRCSTMSLLLSEWVFRPNVVEQPCHLDGLIRGLTTQSSEKFNTFFSSEITDKIFHSKSSFGIDLVAIDLQRGRDHGIAPYNDFRVSCGFPRAMEFLDFNDFIDLNDIDLLMRHYDYVDDVELYIAGLMERHVEGTLTGPTFQCILREQFTRWRNGDRFYYHFNNQSGSFSEDQFKQLQKLNLALILCRNGDNIQTMQVNVFQKPSQRNKLVPCFYIPQLDLVSWKEV